MRPFNEATILDPWTMSNLETSLMLKVTVMLNETTEDCITSRPAA